MTGNAVSRARHSPAPCTEGGEERAENQLRAFPHRLGDSLARTLGEPRSVLDAQADCLDRQSFRASCAALRRSSAESTARAERRQDQGHPDITVTDRLALRIRRKAAHKSRRAPAEGAFTASVRPRQSITDPPNPTGG